MARSAAAVRGQWVAGGGPAMAFSHGAKRALALAGGWFFTALAVGLLHLHAAQIARSLRHLALAAGDRQGPAAGAPQRPRLSAGVTRGTSVERMNTLTASAPDSTSSASSALAVRIERIMRLDARRS